MNRDEAKNILLLYRNPADAEDPQIAEALALAKNDDNLAQWFEKLCARQNALREKFRQIAAPAGLKEQIEAAVKQKLGQAARTTQFDEFKGRLLSALRYDLEKIIFSRRNFALATATVIVALIALATFWFRPQKGDDTFAIYQNQMASVALRGYAMDFMAANPVEIRSYLAKNGAPSDYNFPAALEKIPVTGCAIESWQGKKVSMICFRTGKPLPPGQQSDLWLFVVDRATLKGAPVTSMPQFTKVNRLITSVWTQGDKMYLLGTEGDEQTIRKFL